MGQALTSVHRAFKPSELLVHAVCAHAAHRLQPARSMRTRTITASILILMCACGRGDGGPGAKTSRAVEDPPDRSGALADVFASSLRLWQGDFAIDRNGAATYGLAIDVPPGRAGMQPHLALSYNSNRGQSVYGMGFSLAGISQIERCRKTQAEDGATRE